MDSQNNYIQSLSMFYEDYAMNSENTRIKSQI